MPTISLTFADGDRATFAAKTEETVLAAARRAGIALSSDCEVGDCQTCRATCRSGDVDYDENSYISLTEQEVQAGEILPCVATATTDLEVRIPYERSKLIPAKRFSIEVEAVKKLSESVVSVSAQIVGRTPLKFLPGQYVNLEVPGTDKWRSYSMANAPGDQRRLEFYVRLLQHGVMSRYLTERASPGDSIKCSGPQGTFYLRSGGRPIVMVAGGTGVAPMMSMLRQIIATGERRPVKLCFGVTAETDLFLLDELKEIAGQLSAFEYRVAIAQNTARSEYHAGPVTELIEAPSAAGSDIYLCGPPTMTDRARALATEYGADPAMVFAERFVPTAQDTDKIRAAEAFSS